MMGIERILPRLISDGEYSYIPNRGNAGDALIAHFTFQILGHLGMREQSMAHVILVAGGGGIRDGYTCLPMRLQRIPRHKRVIILPSSVNGHWDLLRSFQNLTLLSREAVTHSLANMNGVNSVLCEDVALSGDYRPMPPRGTGTLVAFRTDAEATPGRPEGNRPISLEWQDLWQYGGCANVARRFVDSIAKYDEIQTNFAHVAIVGAKLGIPVEFHPNSYFKNKALHDSSLRHYPHVRWVE